MSGSVGTVTWTLFLLLLAPGWVELQACTYPCQCPSQPLQCPAGTSHVLDACGCCKVCARQLGELCSLQKPCDHHKGLYCDFSKIHRGSGICLAHEGATCDLLGKIYHNGESFQPTCKLQCICMDGAIGCIPLCSDDLRLPSPECPNPRRVKFRNKCCEEWICEEGSEENRFETAMAAGGDSSSPGTKRAVSYSLSSRAARHLLGMGGSCSTLAFCSTKSSRGKVRPQRSCKMAGLSQPLQLLPAPATFPVSFVCSRLRDGGTAFWVCGCVVGTRR